jgi:eukaryotic-like serine/threonine-protein kinase
MRKGQQALHTAEFLPTLCPPGKTLLRFDHVRRAQQLGRYHLLDRIAFGGMAEIFRAKTFDGNGHAHLVAVKRVLAHLAEDEDFIQMLVDEAKIASVLKHQNIARVYEFARAHGEYFIAMEHVDGKDLRSILERCRQQKRPLPPQHAAYITAEIAAALHAAHTATDGMGRPLRIVHRDVSPSNVICSYTGEVKLCDFGIAKATLSRVQTKTGVIKGKVKYMSPEQALGRKLDHRSDIFSLGACLYEMLTRVPPFVATNEMDLLIKVRDAKYRPVQDLVPGIPREIEAICDRALTRSRTHRYQTSDEFSQALRAFLGNYMPDYSRSHLGRYVRKMFAAEIERDLRRLEEYIVSQDDIDDDVGENLIAQALGPQPEYAQFSPRPTQIRHTTAPPREPMPPPRPSPAPARSRQASGQPMRPARPPSAAPRRNASAPPARPSPAPPPSPPRGPSAPPARDPGGFDLHSAETLILDSNRPAARRRRAEQQKAEDELHAAQTMILDPVRKD